jgi:protocatechuate 3,4-dioxygenase beta subunit
MQAVLGDRVATPGETEGPFWVDEKLNRSDIRPDPTNGQLQAGLPLRLSINVSEIQGGACAPVSGAYVDIWHCNALGAYSDVSGAGNPNNLGQRWLRGYQVTDPHGNVRFLTIYPGWYMGRTVHIHFRIRKFSGATATFNFASQMYFDDGISNAIFSATAPYSSHTNRSPASNLQDNLYNSGLLLRMARKSEYALASFDAVINADLGMRDRNVTPTDEDSLEHQFDFGGGSPRIALV